MKHPPRNLRVLETYAATAPHLDELAKAADAHRNALGFVPRSLFDEFARREHLYVLVDENATPPVYVGHLMFQCSFPRASVLQMFTVPARRRGGLAVVLLDHLKAQLTKLGFASVYARVAEDLAEANAFWAAQKFYVQRTEKGGTSTGRHILVRCHELSTPQLFPASGLDPTNPLGLAIESRDAAPLYLVDLNVLYDLSPRRFRREEVLSLFQADRMGFCRLALSAEVSEELRRTAYAGKTDPMEGYVSIFPSLPLQDTQESSALLSDLSSIIFPGKALQPKDESDLRHVATAIQHKLSGFITSDETLLAAAQAVAGKYGISVLSPAAFALDAATSGATTAVAAPQDTTFSIRDIKGSEENVIRDFLSAQGLSTTEITGGWLPTTAQTRLASRAGLWNEAKLEGYVTWASWSGADSIIIRAATSETSATAIYAARLLLTHAIERLAAHGPRKLSIEVPARQPTLRELAIGMGFRGEPGGRSLAKVVLGRTATEHNWADVREELTSKSGIKLPSKIPKYRGPDQQIEIHTPDGNRRHVSLDDLETLLSPGLLCLPGRPAVITPVQRRYSEALLKCGRQGQLLPQHSSSLFQERHYLSGPNTLVHFKRGTLILFYESLTDGGRGELVAIARTREAYLKPSAELSAADFEQSVLSSETLASIGAAETKTIAGFDSVFALEKPVAMKRLKELGCGRPTDLITTHPIDDTQVRAILGEAFSD